MSSFEMTMPTEEDPSNEMTPQVLLDMAKDKEGKKTKSSSTGSNVGGSY
jgi:hypothetical protein